MIIKKLSGHTETVVVGVDIGGTYVKLAAVEKNGRILKNDSIKIDSFSKSAQENQQKCVKAIRRFVDEIEQEQSQKIKHIGICLPGLADDENKYMYQLPGKLAGIQGFNWQNEFGKEYFVRVLNDSNAALLAEHWIGAAEDYSNVVLLTLGTGVGGAVIINDKLLQGNFGRGGHIGQMIIAPYGMGDVFDIPGSLETLMGDMYVKKRTRSKYHSVKDLVDGFNNNDRVATGYWLDSVHAVSISIVSLINILDPEIVVIGGGIAEAGKSLFKPLNRFKKRYEWCPTGEAVPVKKASFGIYAGAMGAAKFILDHDEAK